MIGDGVAAATGGASQIISATHHCWGDAIGVAERRGMPGGSQMLKKLLAAMSVMTFVATVSAAGFVTLVPVDNSDAATLTDVAVDPIAWAAAGYLTYDLVIDTQGEHWTTAYCLATLTGGAFWNHPNANSFEMAPDPANFGFFGLTRYDSFFTGYNAYPTLGGDTA